MRHQNDPDCSNTRAFPDRPVEVGILALQLYIPSYCVDQAELEKADGVAAGKYTLGLGQKEMGFVSDREDINSICLTVTQNLMETYRIDPRTIGRLEVGTETILDKSKSVKTVLMQLFEPSGNTDIEGADTTNACYGGTSALFNAVHWVESTSWDGRYALVVAGDIAIYASGNARCTGGAGAVAMLVGPHAPLCLEPGLRASHMQHVYDFYKPELMSEYPIVDGSLSIKCFLSSLDTCYARYKEKDRIQRSRSSKDFCSTPYNGSASSTELSLHSFDALLFHTPFCKIVRKSLGRLAFSDFRADIDQHKYAELEKYRTTSLDETYYDKDLERLLVKLSTDIFDAKTAPSLRIAERVGNMYTPSIYGCLISHLVNTTADELSGQRIAMLSYGAGLTATMFSLRLTGDVVRLNALKGALSHAATQLRERKRLSPVDYREMLEAREKTHHLRDYTPIGSIEDLRPGTYYLTEVDHMYRRTYHRVPHEDPTMSQHSYHLPLPELS